MSLFPSPLLSVFAGFLVFLRPTLWGFLCLDFSAPPTLYTVRVFLVFLLSPAPPTFILSVFLGFLVFLSPLCIEFVVFLVFLSPLYSLCFWGFLCFLCFSCFSALYTVCVSGFLCFLCFSAPPTICVSGVSCVSCVSQPHPPFIWSVFLGFLVFLAFLSPTHHFKLLIRITSLILTNQMNS